MLLDLCYCEYYDLNISEVQVQFPARDKSETGRELFAPVPDAALNDCEPYVKPHFNFLTKLETFKTYCREINLMTTYISCDLLCNL